MLTNSRDYTDSVSPFVSPKSNFIFTDASIRGLKSTGKRITFWSRENKGFGLRLTKKGTKTFVYAYRNDDGVLRYLTLGHYPKVSLAQAHRLYFEAAEKVSMGLDPAQDKIDEKKQKDDADTVAQLVEKYLAHCQKMKKSSWPEEERTFKRDLLPNFGDWKAYDVKKKNMSNVLSNIILEREAPSMAKHLLVYARLLFEFAEDMGIIPEDSNPCARIKLRIPKGKGTRHLSPREIYLLWHGLDDCNTLPSLRLAIRLLVCSMTRSIEVRSMKWSDIDKNENVWTIPNPKNKRPHRLYLPKQIWKLLDEAKLYTGDAEYVFTSSFLVKPPAEPRRDLNPLIKTSICQCIRKSYRKFGVTERFTPHDIRRTGATLITALGCPRHWAKLLLNHTDNDVTSIYDLYAYEDEKKTGLEILNYAIERIVTSKNIDSVPSLETLRNEVKQKGFLLKHFGGDNDRHPGFQSTPTGHLSYSISYALGSPVSPKEGIDL